MADTPVAGGVGQQPSDDVEIQAQNASGDGLDAPLTVDKALAELRQAYTYKSELINKESEDTLFALGEQWSDEDKQKLERAGMKPYVDNRIQPNIFLMTGLERQNRSDFKAFPDGGDDGVLADIASRLLKDALKSSDYAFKKSDMFKNGITCGECHLEFYLDNSNDPINAKGRWRQCDGATLIPDPNFKEYDFSDARYLYKVTQAVERDDLIHLYPEKRELIMAASGGVLEYADINDEGGVHRQPIDYPKTGGKSADPTMGPEEEPGMFDLAERYYKKWVDRYFIMDRQLGKMTQAKDMQSGADFVNGYQQEVANEQQQYKLAVQTALAQHEQAMPATPDGQPIPEAARLAHLQQMNALPQPPIARDPNRFTLIKNRVQEIWVFAFAASIDEPLVDEVAWSFPKYRGYPFVPYFARFSTARVRKDKRHLLIQGLTRPVRGAQEKLNRSEMLMLRHLNSTANSGWLSEQDVWVDKEAVKKFGTVPGVNLEYKRGKAPPQRIEPSPLAPGHTGLSASAVDSIKEQLGINADLLATQQSSGDSGRAIALRQRQGLLMVQEIFDNLSRSNVLAGKLILAHLGDMYDTQTAKSVLGTSFLTKNFPPPIVQNPQTGQPMPAPNQFGQPTPYNIQAAEAAIAQVLTTDLGKYHVTVGEAVSSETSRMATAADLSALNQSMPGLVPPEVIIEYSTIPEAAKSEIAQALKAKQMAGQQAIAGATSAAAHAAQSAQAAQLAMIAAEIGKLHGHITGLMAAQTGGSNGKEKNGAGAGPEAGGGAQA
ncbi:MAG: hypothetical protein KGL39_32505 [Patescibacteria group bacterium]|nr:hypothetical protein [Patescibacteria group bacterium]